MDRETIGMTTSQLLSSCPAICQGVPMSRAHSEFFYLLFGGENTSAVVLNRMSAFATNLCVFLSPRSSAYTKREKMVR